jgi:acetylornithine deacetylase/succinyl-diaminopimelate desuccinylase-like protein
MGIPAICVGAYAGGGAHTREEYVEIDSLPIGMDIAIRVISELSEVE